MPAPRELYQIEQMITQRLPSLRVAHAAVLALWVFGTVLAKSACESAVLDELEHQAPRGNLRQRLREWLKHGRDKARPCHAAVDVLAGFPALLRWVIAWWHGPPVLPLAIDAVAHQDRVVALVISVLYRGCAIPVAWHIVPTHQPGAWMPHILTLVDQLAPAIPPTWRTMVMVDRGLWSPRLWQKLQQRRLLPLVRIADGVTIQRTGRKRSVTPARLVPAPGRCWVGRAAVFGADAQQTGTVIVLWAPGHQERWVLLTTLAPREVEHSWYGLRMWIELGFRALKSMGWQWQRTRRTEPDRVARHWLVMAVATLWVLGCGTRVDDARQLARQPDRVRVPPTLPTPTGSGLVSLFRRGMSAARRQLGNGRIWQRLWLRPSALPAPYPDVKVVIHRDPRPDI
jgi:hypothetical protein